MLLVQSQQSAGVPPISPIGDLSDQIPLILNAARKLVRVHQRERAGVETFVRQANLLIHCPESRDYIRSTTPSEQPGTCLSAWPTTLPHGSTVTAIGAKGQRMG